MGRDKAGKRLIDGSSWYAREARLRRWFVVSHGELAPERIQERARCSLGEAHLVASARRLACLEVLEAYERGEITFRKLWRACEYPDQVARQRTAAQLGAAA